MLFPLCAKKNSNYLNNNNFRENSPNIGAANTEFVVVITYKTYWPDNTTYGIKSTFIDETQQNSLTLLTVPRYLMDFLLLTQLSPQPIGRVRMSLFSDYLALFVWEHNATSYYNISVSTLLIKCIPPLYWDPSTSSCVSTCPVANKYSYETHPRQCTSNCFSLISNLYGDADSKCKTTCSTYPYLYYFSGGIQKCTAKCDDEESSLYTDLFDNKCKYSCTNPPYLYFYNGPTKTCVTNCGEYGQYGTAGKICVSKCPSNFPYYYDGIPSTCTNDCSQINSGLILDPTDNACKLVCSAGMKKNSQLKKCEDCGKYLFASLSGAECLSSASLCGNGAIGEPNSRQCILCPPSEIASYDHTKCLSNLTQCEEGSYADRNMKQCVKCPEGQFAAFNHTMCFSDPFLCGEGLIKDSTKMQCITCSTNEFASYNHTACFSNAALCGEGLRGDSSSHQCKSCQVGEFVSSDHLSCLKECAPSTYPNGKSCTEFTCDASCKSCSAKSYLNCTECNQNSYLLNSICISSCPGGYSPYMPDLWKCFKCSDNCFDCFGSGDNQCSSCTNNTFLLQNKCIKECPKPFLTNSIQGTCDCPFECTQCAENGCLGCLNGYFLYQKMCYLTINFRANLSQTRNPLVLQLDVSSALDLAISSSALSITLGPYKFTDFSILLSSENNTTAFILLNFTQNFTEKSELKITIYHFSFSPNT